MRYLSIFILLTGFCQNLMAAVSIQPLTDKSRNPSQVLVLGTPHLSPYSDKVTDAHFAKVHQKLTEYAPKAILVESLRPEDIHTMLNDAQYLDRVIPQFVGKEFVALAKSMQTFLELDAPSALAAFRALPYSSEPKHLKKALKLAVAAYDKPNALLYWHYLKAQNITPKDQHIVAYFNEVSKKQSEISILAIPLAMKLKHPRLYAMDDHFDKAAFLKILPALSKAIESSGMKEKIIASGYISKPTAIIEKAIESGDFTSVYHYFNSKEYQTQVRDVEWSSFVAEAFPNDVGQSRLALWDVRNFNMASHIMGVIATHPQERLLVIVGANHKLFLENHLANAMAVSVTPFQ